MNFKRSRVKIIVLCLLIAVVLSTGFLVAASAQSSGNTVGYWPLDEVKSADGSVITLDSTGVNTGILAGDTLPAVVDGKFDKALQFTGENAVYIPVKFIIGFPPTPKPIYIPVSPNLDIQKYVDIQAWINVPALKDVAYNNIVVKCNHPDQAAAWQNTERILGLSIQGTNDSQITQGALTGFVETDDGGFNQIATTQVIQLNHWMQVEFSRTQSGMHLYIDGKEQAVNVIEGSQNPQGNLVNGTEYYIGHDGFATIDDVKISDLSPPSTSENSFDIGPNIMIVIIAVSIIFAVAWLLRRAIQLWIIRPKI
jgi:hypothetical protein